MLAIVFNQGVAPESQELAPGLLTNAQTFYAPTVAPGTVTLTPPLIGNVSTFPAATVTAGAVLLSVPLLDNVQEFHLPTVSVASDSTSLSPPLLTNTQTFFAPTVSIEDASEPIPAGGGGIWSSRSWRKRYDDLIRDRDPFTEAERPQNAPETARAASIATEAVISREDAAEALRAALGEIERREEELSEFAQAEWDAIGDVYRKELERRQLAFEDAARAFEEAERRELERQAEIARIHLEQQRAAELAWRAMLQADDELILLAA